MHRSNGSGTCIFGNYLPVVSPAWAAHTGQACAATLGYVLLPPAIR